jgi:hypothetical protein
MISPRLKIDPEHHQQRIGSKPEGKADFQSRTNTPFRSELVDPFEEANAACGFARSHALKTTFSASPF